MAPLLVQAPLAERILLLEVERAAGPTTQHLVLMMLLLSLALATTCALLPPYLCAVLDSSNESGALSTICGFTSQVTRSLYLRSYDGQRNDAWNILYHLGGNSPWIPKVDGVVGLSIAAPEGCCVEQIHMMARHAERYPTEGPGMLELFHRIQIANVTLTGDLAFVNEWNFFAPHPSERFENLVSTGPYAGTLEAFSTGVKLRTQYEHLLSQALKTDKTIFWASGSKRVVETARYFGAGFFGLAWTEIARLQVIPEASNMGADTLTPGDTCLNYINNVDDRGHDYGARMLSQFRSTYLPAISDRLAKQNPGMTFATDEIYTMQEICGFETLAKGSSPWCDVFTHEEWQFFEYARDVQHFYRSGPGNPYSAAMGWLWLNATANLLTDGPEAGGLFFSFVHDSDIISLLAALDLFPQDPQLSTSEVMPNRTWRTSQVVPMGGRIIFERLSCPGEQRCWSNAPFYPNHIYCEPADDSVFIRVKVNDGIVAIPGCDSGPGRTCALEDFIARVKRRGEEAGNFTSTCGLSQDARKRITFLHQR